MSRIMNVTVTVDILNCGTFRSTWTYEGKLEDLINSLREQGLKGGGLMSTKIVIEIDGDGLRRLIYDELSRKLNTEIDPNDVTIEVKPSMSYKAEWEKGQFRASISKFI